MPRLTRRILFLMALALPASATAQMRGGGGTGLGGPLPVAVEIKKIPVGAWAEYVLTRGDTPPRKVRLAVVGRDKTGTQWEQSSDMGADRGGLIVTGMTLDDEPTKEGGVKRVVMQRGDADPMEMPAGGMRPGGGQGGPAGQPGQGGPGRGPGARFVKPDAKNLLGKESVKVAAGTFKADHYHEQTAQGAAFDYWITREAGLTGLVKMEIGSGAPADPNDQRGGRGPMRLELAAAGKGAKAAITKAVKPFDPEAFRGAFGRGGGQGGPGQGPPGARGPAGGPAAGNAPSPAGAAAPSAPAKSPTAKP